MTNERRARRIDGISRNQGSVLHGEIGNDARRIRAAMAGVAGDHLTSAEVVVVDLLHHRDHPARRSLSRVVGGEAIPVPVIGGVAVLARHAERRGEEPPLSP